MFKRSLLTFHPCSAPHRRANEHQGARCRHLLAVAEQRTCFIWDGKKSRREQRFLNLKRVLENTKRLPEQASTLTAIVRCNRVLHYPRAVILSR